MSIHAQKLQRVSGVLLDEDGLPMIGANISVQGTDRVTSSDFDGNYTLYASIGDILEVSYIGYKTRYIEVTRQMIREIKKSDTTIRIPQNPVEPLKTEAFKDSMKQNKRDFSSFLPPITNSKQQFESHDNDWYYYSQSLVKSITVPNDTVIHVTYRDSYPKIKYKLELSSSSSLVYVPDSNLPKLQNSFGQGSSGGAGNETPFSWGAAVNGGFDNQLFSQAVHTTQSVKIGLGDIYDSNSFYGVLDYKNDRQANVFNVGRSKLDKWALKLNKKFEDIVTLKEILSILKNKPKIPISTAIVTKSFYHII